MCEQSCHTSFVSFFFFNDTATTEIYTLSLHDALPISHRGGCRQPLHPVAIVENRPGPEEADTGDDLGGDPRAIRRARREHHRHNSEDRRAERNEDVGPEAGALAPQLPFRP